MPKKLKKSIYEKFRDELLAAHTDWVRAPTDDIAIRELNYAKMSLDAYVAELQQKGKVCDKLIALLVRERLIFD